VHQVTGCIAAMLACTHLGGLFSAAAPPLGHFLPGLCIFTMFAKHHTVDEVTPPILAIAINSVSLLACLVGVLTHTKNQVKKE
jgi:hypothetical protein